ncbi:DUF5666 domain-containing protein [Algiphilus sp.]|uniref:DUF5666 domain-containing protein n=1 Tax=Algiphilus sp. TaxID=1872431 RepID=UPI003B52F297
MNSWLEKTVVAGVVGAATTLAACGGGGSPGVAGDVNGTGATTTKVFVRGAITGFGSVIVEGKRFDTNNALVEVDELPSATEDALRVGQIVEIRGRRDDDGNFAADRIRYDAEIRGPVTAIDLEAMTLTVAGQLIRVVGATVFESGDLSTLAVDDPVEISGQITGDGVLVASYVERESEAREETEITGRLAALDTAQRRFRVQSLEVDYNTALISPEGSVLANGQLVEVEGSLANGVLTAARIEIEDAPGNDDDDGREDGTEAEFDGAIANFDAAASSFSIRGIGVRFDGETRFEEGSADDLADGVLVEVEGVFSADGVIVADTIDFEEERSTNAGSERIEIEGDVQSVDVEAGSLQVVGVTILTDERTRFEDDRDDLRAFGLDDLQPGDAVEVAAIRTEAGVVALRIEREDLDDDEGNDDDGEARELAGALESKDAAARELVVTGVRIDASNARFEDDDETVTADVFFESVQIGDFIEAEGRFDENLQRFVASEIEREEDEDEDDNEGDGADASDERDEGGNGEASADEGIDDEDDDDATDDEAEESIEADDSASDAAS